MKPFVRLALLAAMLMSTVSIAGCAGIFRNQNWTAAASARGSRAAGASRPGLFLGGWLLVSA